MRGNASNGDGVYKSTDGGTTWRNVGLAADVPHRRGASCIPRIRTSFMWRRWGISGGRTTSAASIAPPMAAQTWKQVLTRGTERGRGRISRWTRPIRACSTPASGRSAASRGAWIAAAPAAAFGRSTDGGDTWTGSFARARHAARRAGPHRRHRFAGQSRARVGDRGSGRRRRVPLRQRRPHTGPSMNSRERSAPARLVLLAHLRRPEERRTTVYVLNVGMFHSIDGGRTFQHGAPAARRQSRSVDRARTIRSA